MTDSTIWSRRRFQNGEVIVTFMIVLVLKALHCTASGPAIKDRLSAGLNIDFDAVASQPGACWEPTGLPAKGCRHYPSVLDSSSHKALDVVLLQGEKQDGAGDQENHDASLGAPLITRGIEA